MSIGLTNVVQVIFRYDNYAHVALKIATASLDMRLRSATHASRVASLTC